MICFDRPAIEAVLGKIQFVETRSLIAAWTTACHYRIFAPPYPIAMLPPSFEKTPIVTEGKRISLASDMSRSFLPIAAKQEMGGGSRNTSVDPYLVCLFDGRRLASLAEEFFDFTPSSFEPRLYDDGARLHAGLQRLFAEGKRRTPESEFVMEALSDIITVDFLRCVLPREHREKNGTVRHPGIRRALRAIESSYASPLSLDELASIASLSKSRFIVVFKSATGVTPHERLRRVRIEAAERMLRAGRDVTRTCYDVGFSSMSGFETAFRDVVGVGPLKYKRITRE